MSQQPTKPFSVMLAATVKDREALRFPYYASPKIDGVRAYVRGGRLYSRANIEIPNKFVQAVYGHASLEGLDGELARSGMQTTNQCFQETQSACMRVEGTPAVNFWVFDKIDDRSFSTRHTLYMQQVTECHRGSIRYVPQRVVKHLLELEKYEAKILDQGYEGVMLRSPESLYKCGRSTLNENYLLKIKPFETSEAVIFGIFEMEHNQNVAEVSNTGHTKRSSAKAGKVGAGVLGGFFLRDVTTGVEFNCGAGFTAAQRKEFWEMYGIVGKVVRYKYQAIGVKDKPRTPVFLGFRDKRDM